MAAPGDLVFRPLVKENEALGTRLMSFLLPYAPAHANSDQRIRLPQAKVEPLPTVLSGIVFSGSWFLVKKKEPSPFSHPLSRKKKGA